MHLRLGGLVEQSGEVVQRLSDIPIMVGTTWEHYWPNQTTSAKEVKADSTNYLN